MITYNSILSEIQKIPVDKLEDLYLVLKSFNFSEKDPKQNSEKILEYAGLFSSMTDEEYKDFTTSINDTRNDLFTRKFNL